MQMQNQEIMSQFDFEDTINYYNSLTDQQKKLVLGQIPDQILWEELYARDMRRIQKLENIENAARA